MSENESGYLSSRLPVSAKLLTSMASVKGHMKAYPHMNLLKRGSMLKYMIEEEGSTKFYLVTFESKSVSLELFSKVSPLYLMQEALLRALSIMAMVSSDYDFDAKSLFPYLIEVLAAQGIRYCIERLDSGRVASPGDLILAKRISGLLNSNSTLTKELDATRSKLFRMTAFFIINRYGYSASIDEVCRDTGMSGAEILGVLNYMPEIGYKSIMSNRDRFNLVRA